jgi:hypothetical protein
MVKLPVASVVPRAVALEFVTEIASPLSVIAPVNALAAFDSEMSEPGTDNRVVPVTRCIPLAVISLVPITSSEAEFSVPPLVWAQPLSLVRPDTLIVPPVWLSAPGDTPSLTRVPVIDPTDTVFDPELLSPPYETSVGS